MKINAIIESKDGGTLVLDFPRSIYDVYEKLQSVGIRQSPHQITLSDEEGDDVRVKLYSEDEIGKHLLLTLKEHNSLADANMLAFMVDNAKPDFRSKLEQNLLNDQYSSMQEVTDDIKQMLYESGPVKAVFYCPLVGEVTDEEGFSSPVDGRFLKSYAWAVEEALEADTADDEMDMAEFFDEDDSVKAKLVSAKWGVETYRGRLFGRIECSLKEELTDAETEILTDWISGQNSDGYGEHFEQQPIDTEDGDLYFERRCLKEKKPLFFTPYSIAVLGSNARFTHDAATERFAYRPRPIEETLRDMTAWLVSQKAKAGSAL